MKPNKHNIFLARNLWYWFWKKLMDGFAPSDKNGNYKRPRNSVNKNKLKKNSEERGNIYLLVGTSCPWCHRTILFHKYKKLSKKIKIIFLEPNFKNCQWTFKEKFFKKESLSEIYSKISLHNIFRPTLPLLIKEQDEKLIFLSNESSEIMKIFQQLGEYNSEFQEKLGLSQKQLINSIDSDINDGVYKCGFARNQNAYSYASKKLFDRLDQIDHLLEENGGKWILGEYLTYADFYLFPTLVRWELIYKNLFKCSQRELDEFKNILKWRSNFFKLNGVTETCYEKKWLNDYYKVLFPLNPNQIVPLQPSLKKILNKKLIT